MPAGINHLRPTSASAEQGRRLRKGPEGHRWPGPWVTEQNWWRGQLQAVDGFGGATRGAWVPGCLLLVLGPRSMAVWGGSPRIFPCWMQPALGTQRVTLTLILAGRAPLNPIRSSRFPVAPPVPASRWRDSSSSVLGTALGMASVSSRQILRASCPLCVILPGTEADFCFLPGSSPSHMGPSPGPLPSFISHS